MSSTVAHSGGGRRRALLLSVLTALFSLVGCGPGETDPGPGGVTVGEARALDEAAEMLEHQRLDPDELAEPAGTPSPSPTG